MREKIRGVPLNPRPRPWSGRSNYIIRASNKNFRNTSYQMLLEDSIFLFFFAAFFPNHKILLDLTCCYLFYTL